MDNLDIVFIAWLYLLAAYLSVLVLVQIVIAILSVLRLFRREQARVDDGEQPEISAVIAAHNEEYTLPITLDSLATQSAPPSQLVVVSDGSTDSTESAAQTFMSNNGIDGSVLTTNRGGKGKALQRGLDEITTPLTCFVDADVEMDPHALERLRRHFVDPAVVAMSVWVWPRGGLGGPQEAKVRKSGRRRSRFIFESFSAGTRSRRRTRPLPRPLAWSWDV